MKNRFSRAFAAGLAAVVLFLASSGLAAAATKAAPSGKVNLNTASVEQLSTLPGVGEKLAQRIVDYRQKQGPFKSAQELMNVKGIGERNFQKIQGYLSVGEAAPRTAQGR